MESILINHELGKGEKYEALIPQIQALVEGETDVIANISNIIAAIRETFSFFWVGIYFVKAKGSEEELVLGPFQGPVACTRIRKGKGVCGSSWEQKKTIVVPDVELFPGHIACSSLSKSEIVVPVIVKDNVVAVLDVDSEFVAHFDETDKLYLEKIVKLIAAYL
ncbi:MAG: GAF domain-containing protein [Bacteroidetes bacterium]|nr:GAF domain-containing protein [Bacteroidota bacterium]